MKKEVTKNDYFSGKTKHQIICYLNNLINFHLKQLWLLRALVSNTSYTNIVNYTRNVILYKQYSINCLYSIDKIELIFCDL